MTDRGRSGYCTKCGSAVGPADNFCGVCGASLATGASHNASVLGTSPSLAMIVGLAAILVLVLGIGSVAAMTLFRGGAVPSEPSADRREVAAVDKEKTQPSKDAEDTATPRPVSKEEDESVQSGQVSPKKAEEVSEPAPGYNIIETPDGSLSVEVPPSWGIDTGADSEGAGSNWSSFVGENISSSLTTARSLGDWYGGGDQGSGAYVVASRTLAQEYTDEELIFSGIFSEMADNCAAGPYEDFDRSPYSGKLQTWYDCGGSENAFYVMAAAPEGRECVVVAQAKIPGGAGEADREAVQHIFDAFKVDCGSVTSEPSVSSSATTAATAPASAPATAPATASASAPATTPEETSASVPPEDLDCADFSTQAEAQAVLEQDVTDPHRLDDDGDLQACEALPDGEQYASPELYPDPDPSRDDKPMRRPRSAVGPSSGSVPPSPNDDINCDQVGGPIPTPHGDPNNLDGDDDGWACE